MKRLSTTSRGIIIHICLLLFFFAGSYSALAQVTVAFQGGEPGDTWGYTTNGLGAAVASECASAPNIKTGTRSIGVGGNAGGGNCWLGGSGNASNAAHTISLNSINISTSSAYTRTLSFSWGNRFPGCSGTGWDSGENLTFRAYHDGVAQALVTIVNGANNAGYSIQSNSYTWTIPPCVQDFYFVLSITTNRSDELLFMDDARIEAPALNPIINQPSAVMGNTTICQGTAVTYSVINVPGTSYSWSNLPVGASFTSANNSVNSHSIAINWGTAAPGTYSVLVTPSDACGIAPGTAQTVAISVLPPPAPLSITGPTVLCQGDVITLASSYASDNTWSTGANTSSVSVNAAGVYTLTALSGCGPLQASYTVGLNPTANASVTPNGPLSFCQGNSVILTSAMSTGNSWSTGESTPSITVTTTGVYSLTVTTVCGTAVSSTSVNVTPSTITPSITANGPTSFCQGGSVILSSGSGSGNNWSTGATTPTIMVNAAGVYTLTVSNACASASVTQSISIIPATTASITPLGPVTFCQGGSVVLVSNAVNGNSWSTGAVSPSISVNTAGIYTLTVAAACGTTSATQQITVNPLPTAAISVTGSTALCPGTSALLTVSGGTSYNWSTGQTGNNITVTSPGTYTASATNGCGTVVSLPVTITALALPTVQVTGGGIICAGDSLLLTASGGPGFTWSTGSATPSIYVHSSGTYVVSSANSCGTATASAHVDLAAMDATFNSNVVNGNAPLTVQFSNLSSGNITHTQWNFGDGSSSNESSPSHVFQNAGVYTVSLTVQNANGCTDSYTLNITVSSEASAIRVPNVFTPNHDKVNDEFTIYTEGISDFRMSIFDRWGRLVMETTDPAKGWDGNANSGSEAADGTYFYMIIAKGTDGKTYNEKGTVNLFR
jgi:gliding motility-associated-like protein